MIEVNHISKSFGKAGEVSALSNISLNIDEGQLYGLIGPDGAGKTTLFRILTTLLLPDEGFAVIDGMNVVDDYKKLRKILGYMPGRFSLYQDLSVRENLEFYASIFNTTIEVNYALIKDIYVQLEPFNNRRAGALSGGMKQKLALCCALIHKPKVLFLDEPTTGVDVVSRKEFWEMLKRLKNEGITIFVSTPYMDEASLCDKIALIQNGSILSENKPSALTASFNYSLFGVKCNQMNDCRKTLTHWKEILDAYSFGEYLHVKTTKGTIGENDIQEFLLAKGLTDIFIKDVIPTVEDCFIDLMKTKKT
ncbi:MAG: ABC transporter ATP-binding protein [Saprospiraceae bacterium]|jgi:ABC-type multidrug transport system ATPase subunit|nr:ABC transporter ATP-binding protein [Saprospiraceae bacterium]